VRLRPEGLAWRRLGDEIMVLDLHSSTYFSVGGAGTFLFETLGGDDLEEPALVDAVVDRFEVDPATARQDVSTFVTRLRDAGLLVA
jgi:hypothetical protein